MAKYERRARPIALIVCAALIAVTAMAVLAPVPAFADGEQSCRIRGCCSCSGPGENCVCEDNECCWGDTCAGC